MAAHESRQRQRQRRLRAIVRAHKVLHTLRRCQKISPGVASSSSSTQKSAASHTHRKVLPTHVRESENDCPTDAIGHWATLAMRAPLPAGPQVQVDQSNPTGRPLLPGRATSIGFVSVVGLGLCLGLCDDPHTCVRPCPAHVWAPLPPAIASVDVSCAVDVAADAVEAASSDHPLAKVATMLWPVRACWTSNMFDAQVRSFVCFSACRSLPHILSRSPFLSPSLSQTS